MIKILISIVLYYIGIILALKIIENRHRGELIDYGIAFPFCTLSWFAVFLLVGKTALNNIVDFIKDVWKRKRK